jgi:hypothetical protein
MRIGPNDILMEGTKVDINGKQGIVLSHETVPARPDGFIVVHTFKLTHRMDRTHFKPRLIEMKKPITQTAGYSHVWVLA